MSTPSQPNFPQHGTNRLNESFPPRLYATHLMQIFSLHRTRFYLLAKAGQFDRFKLVPTIGRQAWSRELVQKYLDGERVPLKLSKAS